MAKIAILLPKEKMVQYAAKESQSMNFDVVVCKQIATENTVNEARSAISIGADIIIARGYQAKVIKEFTKLPVVEIKLSLQEIGLPIKKAKEISGKKHPFVSLIAFENMLPDLSHVEELFDVDFKVETIENEEMAYDIMEKFGTCTPDLVIGGDMACAAASQKGIPSLFYLSSSESIHTALSNAERIAYAIDAQRQSAAQVQTILEASWNGILRINHSCIISMVNQMAEDLIGVPRDTAIGQNLFDILPQIDKAPIEEILSGRRDTVTSSVTIQKNSYVLIISVVRSDSVKEGAILSFRSIEALSPTPQHQQDFIRLGYRTDMLLSDIKTKNPEVKAVIDKAGIYALSSNPILLYEKTGSRGGILARCIHNASPRHNGPFVSIDMLNLRPEDQISALFNKSAILPDYEATEKKEAGAVLKANRGTLLIRHADTLTIRAQSLLLRTLLPWTFMHSDALPVDIMDVRLILLTERDLGPLVQNGSFLKDLYYRISAMPLRLPPLDDCPEDVASFFEEKIRTYNKQYNKYLNITEGGRQFVKTMHWDGNYIQLDALCEHIVITAGKRQIDEVVLKKTYEELYPTVFSDGKRETVIIYDSPEADRIRFLLEKHHGKRALVADELGISTTTLWRRMKRFGIS